MGVITKGELAMATETWRQAHFGTVMSGSLQLAHQCSRVERALAELGTPFWKLQPPLHIRNFAWMMSRATSSPLRRSQSPFLGLWMSMVGKMSEGPACNPCTDQTHEGSPVVGIYCSNCYIWGLAPRFLLSTYLSEEPEYLYHHNPHEGHHWDSCTCQLVTTGNPNQWKLWRSSTVTSRRLRDWS